MANSIIIQFIELLRATFNIEDESVLPQNRKIQLTLSVFCSLPTSDAEIFPPARVLLVRSHLSQLHSLMKSTEFADCKIVTKDGIEYESHKAILCLKSDVMRKAFQTKETIEAKMNEFRIDCKSDIFDILLPYFYIGRIQDIADIPIMEIYRIAHLYQIENLCSHLADEIAKKSAELVTIGNVLEFTSFAEKFALIALKGFCLNFINRHRSQIIVQPYWNDFHSAHLELVDELLLL